MMLNKQGGQFGNILMNVVLALALMAVIAVIALQASELWKYIGN